MFRDTGRTLPCSSPGICTHAQKTTISIYRIKGAQCTQNNVRHFDSFSEMVEAGQDIWHLPFQ